jgi:ATP-dependent Clp protease ATP-binding subunit ClpA
MRPLQPLRRRRQPRAKTIRPAEQYLARGADEARRLGHNFVGTEHVLLALLRDAGGDASTLLQRLSVTPSAIEETLASWLCGGGPSRKIDPEALASLGIDFDKVRERLERTFGPGALERTQSGCLGIAPRLKLALAHALDYAADRPLRDQHVLLGFLAVPDSLAARVLNEHRVTLERVQALAEGGFA